MGHTLFANGGCYNWISKGSDVATVSAGDGDGCSTNATITSAWYEPSQTEAATRIDALSTAESGVNTKAATISCDVIVRHIDAIKIVSSTKTIYIDHRPMMFSVDGLDSDENTFHTLGELEFEWVTPNLDGRSVISVVPYSSVSYFDDEMEKMELEGKRGSRVLVKGNHTGRGILTVQMRDPVYSRVVS